MRKYKLKNSVEVYKDKHNIHILTLEQHITYALDAGLIHLLRILERGAEFEYIHKSLKFKGITIEKNELNDIIHKLKDDKIVYSVKEDTSLLFQGSNTYSRQIDFFENFDDSSGVENQKKLFKSTVAIVGIGGVGSWTALSLAMSGIGNLVLVDPDIVEASNLTRQIGYDMDTIGTYKVDALSCKIRKINPSVNIKKYKNKILENNLKNKIIFDNVDFVISCIDEPNINKAGKIISDICWDYKIPHIISGGYNGHQGMIGPTIIPEKTICWECIIKAIEKEYEDWQQIIQGKATGSLGCLSAIISNIQVWECIRFLITEDQTPMQNAKGEFNFSNFDLKIKKFYEEQKCNKCRQLRRANND